MFWSSNYVKLRLMRLAVGLDPNGKSVYQIQSELRLLTKVVY